MNSGRGCVAAVALAAVIAACSAACGGTDRLPQIAKGSEPTTRAATPLFDVPLRDPAICRGPDGEYYLTGTVATGLPDGTKPSFDNCRGVQVWRSKDLATWEDLGLVWDLWKEPTKLVMGTLVTHGRDPSLFEDAGKVYLVWGQGFCAELNDGMTALAGPVKTLFTNVQWYPREMRRPEMMGLWGSHLVKQDDWYVWTFTTRTGRAGVNTIDTMAAWSKSLDGPWGEPCLMLSHGGQSTLVADGDGGWLATVSGEDEYSQCPFQPAITPVVSNNGQKQFDLKPYKEGTSVSQFTAAYSLEATELDLWIGFPDLLGIELRDVFVTRIGDDYYACGTPWGDNGKHYKQVVMFHSKDLVHWDRMENLYSVDQLIGDKVAADPRKLEEAIAKDKAGPRSVATTIKMGETKFNKIGDRNYINWMCCGGPGIGAYLLQSVGNDPKGPYRAVSRVPGPSDFFQDPGGPLLLISAGLWMRPFDSVHALIDTPQKEMASGKVALKVSSMPNVSSMKTARWA